MLLLLDKSTFSCELRLSPPCNILFSAWKFYWYTMLIVAPLLLLQREKEWGLKTRTLLKLICTCCPISSHTLNLTILDQKLHGFKYQIEGLARETVVTFSLWLPCERLPLKLTIAVPDCAQFGSWIGGSAAQPLFMGNKTHPLTIFTTTNENTLSWACFHIWRAFCV